MALNQYLQKATNGYNAGQNFHLLKPELVTTVAVGGFRWNIYAQDGTYVAAIPRNRSAQDRGSLYLTHDGTFDNGFACFARKLVGACEIIKTILKEQPSLDDLYRMTSTATTVCAMCGASLTDPLSTSRGIGPECWKKRGDYTILSHVQRQKLLEQNKG